MSADKVLLQRLPTISQQLFEAKRVKDLTFATISEKLGRSEVWVAALFYGQAKPEQSDIEKLASLLDISKDQLDAEMGAHYFPDKGKLIDLPPKDPALYRLFEVVANFGHAYKAIINEKFGDGIMSAIAFTTTVDKEMVGGDPWVKITLVRSINTVFCNVLTNKLGKFLPYKRF